MEKSEFKLADSFLNEIDIFYSAYGDIVYVYKHLFSILSKKELNKKLERWFSIYVEKKDEDWFYSFHKSIRQNDFFENCYNKTNESSNSIAGNLDMILWNVIHIDEKNVLKKMILASFLEFQKEELINQI